jgi:hypothetical protein
MVRLEVLVLLMRSLLRLLEVILLNAPTLAFSRLC